MNKICTTIEQSQKLIELGIDVNTADMYYDVNRYGIQSTPEVAVGKVWSKDIPAWSLSALVELMPKQLDDCKWWLQIDYIHSAISYMGKEDAVLHYVLFYPKKPLFDAAFEMICWLKENEKI